jgi:hypothetical protein
VLAAKVASAEAPTDLRALLRDALQAPSRPKAAAPAVPQATPAPSLPAAEPAPVQAAAVPPAVPEASKAMEEAIRNTSTLDSASAPGPAALEGSSAQQLPPSAAEQLSRAVESSGAPQVSPAVPESLTQAADAGVRLACMWHGWMAGFCMGRPGVRAVRLACRQLRG